MIDNIKCLTHFWLLAEWKCDDHVQWGLGGSRKHPLLNQLHSKAQGVSHLCGGVSRLGCSRPKEGPLWPVSTLGIIFKELYFYIHFICCAFSKMNEVWKRQASMTYNYKRNTVLSNNVWVIKYVSSYSLHWLIQMICFKNVTTVDNDVV